MRKHSFEFLSKSNFINKLKIKVDTNEHEQVAELQVDEQVPEKDEPGLIDDDLFESIVRPIFELALPDRAFVLEST